MTRTSGARKVPNHSILLISPFLTRGGAKGGVADFCDLLMKYLGSDFYVDNLRIGRRQDTGAGLSRLPHFLGDMGRFTAKLMRGNYDLVHLNASFKIFSLLRDSVYTVVADRLFNKKALILFHGWDSALSERILRSIFLGVLFRIVYKRDNIRLGVLSAFHKEQLVKMGITSDRIHVMTTMYEGGAGQEGNLIAGREHNRINLLFISRLLRSKGVYIAVEVAERMAKDGRNDFLLTILGDGPEYEGVEAFIRSRKLGNVVKLKGYLTGQEKQRVLDQSDIFLFPTYYGEGCPIVLLEAMGAGLAVVSTPVAAIPEIVQDGENGFLIASRDLEDFSRAVVRLLEDKDLRERIQRANREKALRNYEARTVTKNFESLYSFLIHEHIG